MLVEFAGQMVRIDGRDEFDFSLDIIRDMFSDDIAVNSDERRDFPHEFSACEQPKNLEAFHDPSIRIIVP